MKLLTNLRKWISTTWKNLMPGSICHECEKVAYGNEYKTTKAGIEIPIMVTYCQRTCGRVGKVKECEHFKPNKHPNIQIWYP